jgi:peptide/nickel transport system permease protein
MGNQSVQRFGLIRLRDGLIVLWLVVTVIFVLGHMVGNPARAMLPDDATEEQVAQLERLLGLDRPFHERYVNYLTGLLQADFGESFWQKRPTLTIVLEALPFTLLLTATGIVLAGLLGSLFGLLAGARPGSLVDRLANAVSVVVLSVPNFWLALLLIVVVAVELRLVPTSGFNSPQGLILPAATVGLVHAARIFQLVRSATFEEMTKPYTLVARGKGLREQVILWKHVLRNIGVMVVTLVGWEYVRMMGGGAFAIEYVFAWPGIGQLMIQAASRRDFPLLQTTVILSGAFVIVANFVVDFLYRAFDPRLRVA